ncbi:hypothetical protein VTO58DRAFT_107122 [Aureobasidium pullulans]
MFLQRDDLPQQRQTTGCQAKRCPRLSLNWTQFEEEALSTTTASHPQDTTIPASSPPCNVSFQWSSSSLRRSLPHSSPGHENNTRATYSSSPCNPGPLDPTPRPSTSPATVARHSPLSLPLRLPLYPRARPLL